MSQLQLRNVLLVIVRFSSKSQLEAESVSGPMSLHPVSLLTRGVDFPEFIPGVVESQRWLKFKQPQFHPSS